MKFMWMTIEHSKLYLLRKGILTDSLIKNPATVLKGKYKNLWLYIKIDYIAIIIKYIGFSFNFWYEKIIFPA